MGLILWEPDDLEFTQTELGHLQWILKKDLLVYLQITFCIMNNKSIASYFQSQDMFLVGPPGQIRRHLAMAFAELTSREVEYVALSRDTTEADLKQRREVIGKTAQYFDQVRNHSS